MFGRQMTRLCRIAAISLIALMVTANVAMADDLIADGDGVVAVGNNDMSFGNNVCRGVATSKPVAVAIKRNGTGNPVYKDGSSVSVTASYSGSAGVSATDPGSITMPGDWAAQPNNTMSPAAFGTVTVNTTTLGPFSGTVTYTATGVNASDQALVKIDKMTVSGTVIVCDTTPPETTIDTAPASPTNSTSAAFTYSSSETGSSFECKLDLGTFASCPAAGKSYTGLGEGSHTFEVRATDAAGNTDASPASHTWTIDLTPPETTIVTAPPVLTNSSNAAFTYTSDESGSSFACKLDLGGFASCPASGNSYSDLAEGPHTFQVQATDAAGNTDGSPASYDWTIDLTPPAVSAPDLTDASDSGISQVDDVTNDATPSFTGTAEDGTTVELLRDGSAVDSTTASGGVWSFTSTALVDGTYEFTARATDAAGNTATSAVLSVVVDGTSPSIVEASRLPAANAFGWNNTAVTVTWNCDDALSGALSATDDDTVSGEGAGQSANGSCSDVAGNTATASRDGINIDLTNPLISASATSDGSTYPGGVWTNDEVEVTFGCSDGLAGVASVTAPVTVGEGENQSVSGTCQDKAGNTAGTSFGDIDVDLTAPSIVEASRLPAANGFGWNNTAVTVTWNCDDDLSGVVSATDDDTVATEGENQTANGVCTDLAGNTATASRDGINIDWTAPSISASATANGAPYTGGWTKYDVTVSFDCSDSLSGVASVTAPVTVGEGADQSVPGTCEDEAGNSAATSFDGIDVDKTAPTIEFASRLPAANTFGWNNSAVTVTWNCDDDLSGVVSPTDEDTVSIEGVDQMANGLCADLAGNTASASYGNIDIDLTDPYDISWLGGPEAGASYYYGFVPPAPTCDAEDDLSLLDICTVTGYGTGVGSHTMTATAFDRAGNDATATRSYSVLAWTLRGFYAPVDMNGVWNTVKGGSTVPLKWEMFAGSTELTDTSLVGLSAHLVSCGATTAEDAVEVTATGGTSLRYDTSGGQFIYNWQTPKKPGTCYRVTMTAADGSSLSALFKLK